MAYDPSTRRLALRLLRRPGLVLADIEARTGVNRRTLREWARKAGIDPRPRGDQTLYPAETRKRAVDMYLEGKRMSAISAATGASSASIRVWVQAAGHPLRRTHTNARLDPRTVLELDREHGPKRAAELLGCSQGSIHYHRKRARHG